MNYTVITNASGSRHIDINDEHLNTIHTYQLLDRLTDSNGIVDDAALERLRMKARSLLEAGVSKDNSLLHLCLDVLYHDNMKSIGLSNLIKTYRQWQSKRSQEEGLRETDGEQ